MRSTSSNKKKKTTEVAENTNVFNAEDLQWVDDFKYTPTYSNIILAQVGRFTRRFVQKGSTEISW